MKGLPCDVCGTLFPTPIRLAGHRQTQKHKDEAAKKGVEEEVEVAGFPCDICGGKPFSNISNLRRHQKESASHKKKEEFLLQLLKDGEGEI